MNRDREGAVNEVRPQEGEMVVVVGRAAGNIDIDADMG